MGVRKPKPVPLLVRSNSIINSKIHYLLTLDNLRPSAEARGKGKRLTSLGLTAKGAAPTDLPLSCSESTFAFFGPVVWLAQVMEQKYRPQLDGIRAFCIIFTILNHIPGKPAFINGTVGVDVFFPLSGWLITWLLLEEHKKTGAVHLKSFYVRRFFRIVPLYYFTIALYLFAAISVFFSSGHTSKLDELRAASVYLLSFNSEYRPDEAGVVFGHAWTLGIEEKFYLLWPLLIFLFNRSNVIVAVSAIALLTLLFVLFGIDNYLIRGYFGLGTGAGLALCINRNGRAISFFQTVSLGGISLVTMLIMYTGLIASPHVLWHLGLAASGALLIVSVWFCDTQWVARFLATPVLAWLGTLTYAIYLLQTLAINVGQALLTKFHVPNHFLMLFIASYGISILAAWALHIAVEQPAINFGRKLARRQTACASATQRAA